MVRWGREGQSVLCAQQVQSQQARTCAVSVIVRRCKGLPA